MSSSYSNRHSIRLPGYDYSTAGIYFITICTRDRATPLGFIWRSEIQLTAAGKIAIRTWFELPARFPTIELDQFIVMPNHIHGIVVLYKPGAASPAPTNPTSDSLPTLGHIVGTFKSLSTAYLHRELESRGPFWQRNFYEHIIRSGKSLDDIRRYIHNNPQRWSFDRENPQNHRTSKILSSPLG